MAQLRRIFLGRRKGRLKVTFSSRAINHQSVVLVSASEGDEGNSTASPKRFVGAANVHVENIAPFDGGVAFIISILWNDPLPIWADIYVADGFPNGFIRAG
jgi:hypothetical protein